jgi:hypothetical protein
VVLTAAAKLASFETFQLTGVAEPTLNKRLKLCKDTALNSSNDLAIANVFVGNTSGKAEAVPLSGAVTIDNTGLVAIVDDAVTTAKILTVRF